MTKPQFLFPPALGLEKEGGSARGGVATNSGVCVSVFVSTSVSERDNMCYA